VTPDERIGLSESMAERRASEGGYDAVVATRDGSPVMRSDIGRVRPVLFLDLVGDKVVRAQPEE
jgi:hypothetical protein